LKIPQPTTILPGSDVRSQQGVKLGDLHVGNFEILRKEKEVALTFVPKPGPKECFGVEGATSDAGAQRRTNILLRAHITFFVDLRKR
jgi:hypothetical protein